jgi:Rha family phage regulatory protein
MSTLNELKVFGAGTTMTSREVANVTGKRHDNVLRDIDNLLEQMDSSELRNGFKSSTYTSGDSSREYRQFVMDQDAVLLLITGYSATLRWKVIQYMRKLEAEVNTYPRDVADELFGND